MDKERESGEGVSETEQRGGGVDNKAVHPSCLKPCSMLTL